MALGFKTIRVTRYQTEDGMIFETAYEARKHYQLEQLEKLMLTYGLDEGFERDTMRSFLLSHAASLSEILREVANLDQLTISKPKASAQ